MKNIINTAIIFIAGGLLLSSCGQDFFDINTDPKAANFEQVQVEYFLNNSIIGAQMDPHVAERQFILYWKTGARQHRLNGTIATGTYNDGWTIDNYSYLSGWLKTATLAITVAQQKIDAGVSLAYTNNLMQIARIWRVYLMSEFTDNYGPMPIDGFQGVNPEFKDVKTVYYFMLSELADAVSKINVNVQNPAGLAKYDQAYGFNYLKWVKYGNSMRMRLAMRLSEVDPAKAKAEFEAAAAGPIITDSGDIFAIAERPGWDALTGVMSREWNSQPLSATLNNLYIGLGGIPTSAQVPAQFHANIKPADYMGVRYEEHMGTFTNDPTAGFIFDGLYPVMDPRAYKAFIIPGWFDNPDFSFFPSWTQDARNTNRNLLAVTGTGVLRTLNGAGTWNAACIGAWGPKSARNQFSFFIGTNPRLAQRYRSSNNSRVFFGNWETYFLLAEASVRGWSIPISGKLAYENGIAASFAYFGVSQFLNDYLLSESYNRAGTSVSWEHITEPPATVQMSFIDGYTLQAGTWTFRYPVNHLHNNGATKNDRLTKIITQKYLAQLPYLPLEAWNDHRRLGLPFFENPSVEQPIVTLPALTQATFMESRSQFFPQRVPYPSTLQNSNPDGYAQALQHLGGPDAVLTPLWWAKRN